MRCANGAQCRGTCGGSRVCAGEKERGYRRVSNKKRAPSPEGFQIKKGSVTGALGLNIASEEDAPGYFFFFAAAFFLGAAFLVAFFIEVILRISKFAIRKSQCDSYIELLDANVKKKMHLSARDAFVRRAGALCWFSGST